MGTRGTTLVEVVVAATLLAIGIAAAVGSSRAALLLADRGGRQADAAGTAATALDTAALACAEGWRTGPGGVDARWSVSGGGAVARFTVVVTWPAVGGQDTARVEATGWCVP